MKKILLACSAGMSTSMLVSKMKKSAEEKNIEVDIEAIPVAEVEDKINAENIDILLLGPQVRYMDKKMADLLDPKNIPHSIVSMQDYGMMNGEKVLEEALKIMK
ncbi:PTS sugar transporter subunit IIB [Anaerococcus sp. AGMB09787]|uniref:PTS sugar transporter subunit IIB n=1 Tax=Anaerococcus sp. AGMB09787 TaxID=2922869 RepID=UPI001FAEAB6D|nr:PTS sugar transporter subunit IIB [Anaerococcus sp. AGMB09787]